MNDEFPNELATNAWTGNPDDIRAPLGSGARTWAQNPPLPGLQTLSKPDAPDIRDWRNAQVGWGVVIPARPDRSNADNAALKDMPEALRELCKFRNGAVFGWSEANGVKNLLRYLPDDNSSAARPIEIGDIDRGVASNALPRYMLIFGGPKQIPWKLQYTLNLCALVGRLDLDDEGLERYANAVIHTWPGSNIDVSKCLLWSVDEGGSSITALMKNTVATPLLGKLNGEDKIGTTARFLTAKDATHGQLNGALAQDKPGLILTTSHGSTSPLNDDVAMRGDLGLPIDAKSAKLPLSDFLAAWQPDGAIWYSYACCSAGSDDGTMFKGLLDSNAGLAQLFEQVGKLGAQSAILPRTLLGSEKPLRAFIGHVEPTFNWTLISAGTRQTLTTSLTEGLSDLFLKVPMTIGGAFERYFRQVGTLLNQWQIAHNAIVDLDPNAENMALRYQLTALDRRSLVILGDPAVALPALH